jgi:hypothetical protein
MACWGSACESNFDPMEDNELYDFSMYGYLDLNADTQWIRVMPILDTLISRNSAPLDIEVTLTRESNGEVEVLNDSLFFYNNVAYTWNYWTTATLQLDEEYTVRAESSAGEYSEATVRIPRPFPEPEIEYSEGDERGNVSGQGAENLVVAQAIYTVIVYDQGFPSRPFEVAFSNIGLTQVRENGNYNFTIQAWPVLMNETGKPQSQISIQKRELIVASGSEDWPDLSGLTEYEITIPGVVSNVENGTGFIGGVASHKVELRTTQ